MSQTKDKTGFGSLNIGQRKMYDGNSNLIDIYEIRLGTKLVFRKPSPVTFTFTITEGCEIDLSPLFGIDLENIQWGDGTRTFNSFSHTYAAAGTYTIIGNFNEIYEIDDNFLSNLPISHIEFSHFSEVAKIGNNFLKDNNELENVNLNGLLNVALVGNHFLANSSLTNIDFTGFSNNLKSIGNYFLQNNANMQTIDINKLVNLETIGDNFLDSNTFDYLDMSKMVGLKSIGSNYLNDCNELVRLDVPLVLFPQEDPATGQQKDWPPRLSSWGNLDKIELIVCRQYYKQYLDAPVWLEKADLMNPGYKTWKNVYDSHDTWEQLDTQYENWEELTEI